MARALGPDDIGPVDVAVIVFDDNEFNGEIAPALAELHDSGTVQILDLAFVAKGEDGKTVVIEVEDSSAAERFDGLSEELDLLNDEDLDYFAADLEPGTSALLVVWENTWAKRVAGAVRDNNGRLAGMMRIPHETVAAAINALQDEE